MNFSIYCILTTFLVVNGNLIQDKAISPRFTLDEAKKAVEALQQTIQELTQSSIPTTIALVRTITDRRDQFLRKMELGKIEVVHQYTEQINEIAQYYIGKGYDEVSTCMDNSTIELEGDLAYVELRVCAAAPSLETTNTVSEFLADQIKILEVPKNIYSTLEDCGETQVCINQAMAEVTEASKVVPKEIEAALTAAESATTQLINVLVINCVKDRLKQLMDKEDAITAKMVICMVDIANRSTTILPISTSSTPEVPTKLPQNA